MRLVTPRLATDVSGIPNRITGKPVVTVEISVYTQNPLVNLPGTLRLACDPA
jgi:hypothetical protein